VPLSLRGLCTPAHRHLLAFPKRHDSAAMDGRLSEGARVDKGDRGKRGAGVGKRIGGRLCARIAVSAPLV